MLLGSKGDKIKKRRMRWAGCVARTERRKTYRVFMRESEGKDHLEDLRVNGRKI
jgi:hypothetical protein